MSARCVGGFPEAVDGVSIDTRTLQPGDLFFAIKGDARDGHDFVPAALAKGAAAAVVALDRAGEFEGQGCLIVVPDVLDALGLARARGAGADARPHRRGHRLRRQDRHQGSAAHGPGRPGPDPCVRCVLQQSLGRAADAGAHASADADFGVFEIGMNHAGEITPLTRMVRPHVAVITTVEPVHLENLGSRSKPSRTPRPRSSWGSSLAARP